MISKGELRKQLKAIRARMSESVDASREASRVIQNRLAELPAWREAETILFYINVRDEAQTGLLLKSGLADRKRCVVPYCEEDQLLLVRLAHTEELAPAAFGILEPNGALRNNPARHISPDQIDLVITPGLGFDRNGGRIGFGRGYYDRLLSQLRPDALRVGLAFHCQLVDQIPLESHDQPMDLVITEQELIPASPKGKIALSGLSET